MCVYMYVCVRVISCAYCTYRQHCVAQQGDQKPEPPNDEQDGAQHPAE